MTDDLERRRKRLIYRSSYTGTKETDLLLGAFARRHVPQFTAEQVARYEALLDINQDPEIYAWASGQRPVPPAYDNDVMMLLKSFKLQDQ